MFFLIKFQTFSPFLGSSAPGLYTKFTSGSEGSQPPSPTQFSRPLPFEIQVPPGVGLSSSKCHDRLLSLRMLKLKLKIPDWILTRPKFFVTRPNGRPKFFVTRPNGRPCRGPDPSAESGPKWRPKFSGRWPKWRPKFPGRRSKCGLNFRDGGRNAA